MRSGTAASVQGDKDTGGLPSCPPEPQTDLDARYMAGEADSRAMNAPLQGASWTEDELDVAVDTYMEMLRHEEMGNRYTKAEFRTEALKGGLSGRSASSFELRMGNISHLLEQAGLPRIAGYKPYRNVGRQVADALYRSIARYHPEAQDFVSSADDEVARDRAAKIASRPSSIPLPPRGTARPEVVAADSTTFVRSTAVAAWAMRRARGRCELCTSPAPFMTASGRPFLEVHHIEPLSEGGPDTVDNVAALCPNCHRRCHHAPEALNLRAQLARDIRDRNENAAEP